MSKIRPIDNDNKKKYLAHLLAAGVSAKKAAELAGLRPRHVEIMMQGSLFALEVDRARTDLMREKIAQFEKAAADELANCLLVAKQIRDDEMAKPNDRLAANSQIMSHILSRAPKMAGETSVTAKITMSEEKRNLVNTAMNEILPVLEIESTSDSTG